MSGHISSDLVHATPHPYRIKASENRSVSDRTSKNSGEPENRSQRERDQERQKSMISSSETSFLKAWKSPSGHWKQKNRLGQNLLVLSFFLLLFLNHAKAAPRRTKRASTKIKAAIYNEDGFYLTITAHGARGVDRENPNTVLELATVGIHGEITIRGIAADMFLSMNSTGHVSVTKAKTKETVFIDDIEFLPLRSFRSNAHPKYYLAITTSRRVTSSKTKKDKDAKFVIQI